MANQKMGITVKKLAGIILGAAIGLSGCGSSGTSNDQGTSFLATGWFSSATGSAGATGATFSLLEINTPGLLVFMGLQNRLSSQFLRVTQISCSYDVPGSAVSLDQDSFNYSSVLGGSASTSTDLPSSIKVQFPIVSNDVIAYLNSRSSELPALPFSLVIECSATGISQSGAVYQTNPLFFTAIATDDTVIAEPDTGTAIVDPATIDETNIVTDDDTGSTDDTSAL